MNATPSHRARAHRWLVTPALALLFLGCAPTLPLAPRTTEVAADYLFFRKGDSAEGKLDPNAHGGTSRMWVEVARNAGGRAPVRFAETVSSGVGEAWRATVWMALLAASATLETDPMSIRVTVETDGSVDGPSAGGLMAAVIVAGWRGDAVDLNTTMTGTINPDLTIGPVGGVPEKVQAAIDAGKKRIGIPVGQRRSQSRRTGEMVDVVALGRARGVEVIEIEDVAGACLLLTGHVTASITPLSETDMALPEWARQLLADRATLTIGNVLEAQAELRPLAESLSAVGAVPAEAMARAAEAKAFLDAGQATAAFFSGLEAHRVYLEHQTRLLTRLGVGHGEWKTVRDLLGRLRVEVQHGLETTLPRWKAQKPSMAVEVPMVLEAFDGLIQTLRGLAQGQAAAESSPALGRLLNTRGYVPSGAELPSLLDAAGDYAANLATAQARLLAATVLLDLGAEWERRTVEPRGRPIPEPVLAALAAEYERVADANLGYVDAVLVRPVASELEEGVEKVRERLAANDPDFRQAYMSRVLPSLLSKDLLDARQKRFASLSGAVASYFASASVISKRYSLNADFDSSGGGLIAVRHRTAFESMLRLAERNARAVAAQCLTELGEVPLSTRIEYNLARELDAAGLRLEKTDPVGAVRRRVDALTHLWRAWTHGRLAITTERRWASSGEAAAQK